ncbi:hypothetical protein GALMADRAFT_143149 [Galerina marginata CBS 339.88]|uniref:Uncharacterized protein n=1 Tax=Galerina marginata (strain CBS 339.88) TaxID=685588 RepID=A0A067SMZ2_GALM3|nr:hypothetical protein GALMADRAFT_143149 [Galerina marginata CBS 339.88]
MTNDISTNYTYRPRGRIGRQSYAAVGRNPSQMPDSLTEATRNPSGRSDEQGGNQHRGGMIIEDINQETSVNVGSSTVDRGKSECFQTTACWIAAEHALRHARSNVSLISEIFDKWHIPKSEYVVLAGFDESLIRSGIGYLEQIHVFVSAEVDATSPLLPELGKLFSPFSSILFTDSSSYHLPVFKADGSVWEFDELVYYTASKFGDGGSSAKTPLTVISLSPNPDPADGPTGFSQGSDHDSREGDKDAERRSGKGKEKDRGNEDEAGKGEKDDKHPLDNPYQPYEGRTITGPAEISYEIVARIYPVGDEEKTFQSLTIHGNLIIKTAPPIRNSESCQFPKRHVQFMELTFDTESTTDAAYKQFHVRVVVNSQQENARVHAIKPKRTRASDGEEKHSSSKKATRNRDITAGITLGLQPLGAISGSATKTSEIATGSERKRYNSGITEHHRDGIVHWGFNIDDENLQKRGIDMQEDVLPTVSFEFVGDSPVPAPPPKSMDIVISSYWSTMLPREPKGTWIRQLLRLGDSSGSTQTTSYSNLLQIVVLKTEPSNLSESSHYRAKMKVMSGVSDQPEVKRPAADWVNVTPVIVNNKRTLSKLNLPTVAKFELSDNCIQISENSSRDNQSH